MIQVNVLTHNDLIKKIEVSGHAYSGEPGFDLVCAGVSSIAVGALNAFDELSQGCDLVLKETPYIKIECKDANQENQLLMNFLLIQFKTIEHVHSEHININVKEESQWNSY